MKKKTGIVLAMLLGVAPAAKSATGPMGMQLPSGYEHRPKQGIDTAVGDIVKGDRVVLTYDIGRLAGLHVRPEDRPSCNWYDELKVNGQTMRYCVSKDRHLAVTFVETSGNFSGTLKDDQEMAEVLSMLKTYGSASAKKQPGGR
jgi:hypothetical protein